MFETCPTEEGQIDYCSDWFNPSQNCTPDYYNVCANGPNADSGVPDNDCNYDSYEGDGMARIFFYPGGGEPLAVKLSDTLQTNENYEFSMKLKRDCSYGACGSVGVLFTDTVFSIGGYCNDFAVTPQLQRNRFDIMNSYEWYTYIDTLTAEGGERYMTITNFLSESLFVLENGPIVGAAGYWVDNVRLKRIEKLSLSALLIKPDIKLTSDLVSEQLEITTDKRVQLHLMDISGRMVLSEHLNSGRNSINVSSIPNGMYVAVFTSENSQTTSRKIVKVN